MISGPNILVIAGEASGDRHGARLVAEIRRMLPQAQLQGIGGEAMAAQGVSLLARAEDLAVVGLTEVAGRLPAVIQALREVNQVLRESVRPSPSSSIFRISTSWWSGWPSGAACR